MRVFKLYFSAIWLALVCALLQARVEAGNDWSIDPKFRQFAEPLREHLDSYNLTPANNFGAEVRGYHRWPRLFDGYETKQVVKDQRCERFAGGW